MFAPRTNHKSLTLLTSTVLALGLCVSPSTTTVYAAEKPGDSLHWTTCPADITTNTPPMSMQCTTFKVPLDYGKPDDKKITILNIPAELSLSTLAGLDNLLLISGLG